jgi:hypothetical protein
MDTPMSLWQEFAKLTTGYVDPVGTWLGIFLAIPILATWYQVTLGKKRRHRRWAEQIRKKRGSRPAILIVDLLDGKSLLSTVERFRAGDEGLKAIPSECIFLISRDRRIGANDMGPLSQEMREKAAEILKNGTDVLHVFFGGPCIAAALIGAEFANACRVILYHQQQGDYFNWGPLRHFPDS